MTKFRPFNRSHRSHAGPGLLLLLLLFSVTGTCVAEVVAKDSTGQTIKLPQPARRIVSLAPHVTELLFAAGAGKWLVGADEFSDFPPPARGITRVGDATRLDRERIVSLRPDLIVAWGSGNSRSELQALQALGIPVFISEIRQLDDIPQQIEDLGILVGSTVIAKAAAEKFRRHLAELRARYEGRKPVQVFYQISAMPLFTINEEHLISAVINLCGGQNLFGDLGVLAPSISLEAVVAAAPDVILYGEYPGHGQAVVVDFWREWQVVPAVAYSQIYGIQADLLHRAGPRLLQGAEALCSALDVARRD